MPTKRLPLGICDNCEQPFPPGLSWHTKRGPRLYCSIECRNTGNSRLGAQKHAETQRKRVQSGEWQPPRAYMTPEQISQAQSKAARRGRLREIAEGRWRNPALSPAARAKLSRPRVYMDFPILHRAIEKLRQGARVAELTTEEAQAYREYRVRLRAARLDKIRQYFREYYRRCMADPTRREKLRQRWRKKQSDPVESEQENQGESNETQ